MKDPGGTRIQDLIHCTYSKLPTELLGHAFKHTLRVKSSAYCAHLLANLHTDVIATASLSQLDINVHRCLTGVIHILNFSRIELSISQLGFRC